MANTSVDETTSTAETGEREETPLSLIGQVLRDGVVGAVAGAAGSGALVGSLLVAALLGGFNVESLALTAELLGFAALVGAENVLAVGVGIFLLGGLVVWPLVLATLGWYLPGDGYAEKGLPFGFVIWTGFGVGYYDGYAGLGLAAYLGLSLLGHLGYGFVTGAVMDRAFGADDLPVVTETIRGPGRREDETEPTAETTADGPAVESTDGAGETARDGDDSTADPDVAAVTAAAANATTEAATTTETTADDPAVDGTDTGVADTEGTTVIPGLDEHEQGVPPLLRFDQALSRIEAELDGRQIEQFEAMKREYRELVAGDGTPHSRVSDLKSHATALRDSLPPEEGITRWIDSIDTRLDQYLETHDTSDTLHLTGVTFFEDGDPVDSIEELREELATVRVTVVNQGSRSGAVVKLEFRRADPADPEGTGILLRSDELSMGYIDPGERKSLETRVYVPSIAEWYEATALDPAEGQVFLSDVDEVREG